MKVNYLKRKIYGDKNEQLLEFIKQEFEQRGNIPAHHYRNNLNTLKKLDNDTLNTALARVNALEEANSIHRVLGAVFAVILALLLAYSKLATVITSNEKLSIVLYFIVFASTFACVSKFIKMANDKRITAIYFKNLIKEVRK